MSGPPDATAPRVLHLTRDHPPRAAGGISTAVAGLARTVGPAAVLSFDGWRPTRGGAAGTRRERDGAVEVLRLGGPDGLDDAAAFAQRFGPDLLLVHHGMLWDFGARLRRELGVPAVLFVHVLQAAMNRLRGVERTMSGDAQARALAEADAVLAPSASAAASLEADFPGVRPRVAPLGVTRSPLPRRPEPGRLLYVGRFDPAKGSDLFFAARPAILAGAPEAGFVVAGGLPENRKGERRALRRWREGAPEAVQERTELLGWLDAEALDAQYARAAALLVPSRLETFGQAAIEGMVRGLPVVVSDCAALAEAVRDGETGLVVPAGDAAALAEAALRLLRDPALAAGLGANAAEVAAGRTWPARRGDWAALLAELAR